MSDDVIKLLALINHYGGELTVDSLAGTVGWDLQQVPPEVVAEVERGVAQCGPELLRIFDDETADATPVMVH